MIGLLWLVGPMMPSKVNSKFKRLQILSAAMMSFSHGSNDAQKAMGIMTLALVSAGYLDTFEVPFWGENLCSDGYVLGYGSRRMAHYSHNGRKNL